MKILTIHRKIDFKNKKSLANSEESEAKKYPTKGERFATTLR